MARFRYSLQNILNIKEKMETQAKQEFGTAQAALNVETEHLERLKERRREYEEQSAGLLKGQHCGNAGNPGGKSKGKCGSCQRTDGRGHEGKKDA